MARFSMSRGHVGLDVGTTAVRAAEVKGGERSPVVSRFGQVLLPRGSVHDGEVQDVEAVGQAIATLWKRAGFTGRVVRIGVANRKVVVRQIELPAMARQDLEGAIRFQAQDYIPIPLAEAVMDFEVLDEFVNPEGDAVQRILVVAAERVMVDPLVSAVRLAKLEPEVLELNAYPLVRALGGEAAVESEVELLVDVGGGVTNIVIHQGGKIRFTRILPSLGGDDFTQAICDTLGLEWDDAESLKLRASDAVSTRAQGEDAESPGPRPGTGSETDDQSWSPEEDAPEGGSPGDDEPADEEDSGEATDGDVTAGQPFEPPEMETSRAGLEVDDALVQRAIDVLGSVTMRFAGEIRGSVDFYTTQSGALPLRAAVLTGGGSLLGGLDEQVGSALRISTEPGRVFDRVPVGKVKLSREQIGVAEPFLGIAVGLALGGLEN